MGEMDTPIHVFKEGRVYTLVEGKVVTAVGEDEFMGQGGDQGVGPVEMPSPPPDIQNDLSGTESCPGCGAPTSLNDNYCPQCGEPVSSNGPEYTGIGAEPFDTVSPERAHAIATVTTPNGLSGRVLGKVAGLWGDQVTVRLENGNIVHLPVEKDFKFASDTPELPENPVAALNTRLSASVEGDAASLKARARELTQIQHDAQTLIAGEKDSLQVEALDEIALTARYEAKEVDAALQHLAELEGQAYEPPAPFGINVVEQESMGRGDGTWLDATLNDMIAEAEATDFDQIMNEGPEALVAGLDDVALAEAGATQSIASRWISSKTAAAAPQVRERYMKVWLARVEECRRAELMGRKQVVQQKEAAIQEEDYSDLPDEFGFGV